MKEAKQTQWQRHIEQQKRSGKSQEEYCRKEKLSASSFQYWKNKLEKAPQHTFVRAGEQDHVELILANGVSLRVAPANLPAVLEALHVSYSRRNASVPLLCPDRHEGRL